MPYYGSYIVMPCGIQQQMQQQPQAIEWLILFAIFCCVCITIEVNASQMYIRFTFISKKKFN